MSSGSPYRQTFASIIDGTVVNVGTYSPAPAAPEPMTIGFLGLGFGLVLVRRR